MLVLTDFPGHFSSILPELRDIQKNHAPRENKLSIRYRVQDIAAYVSPHSALYIISLPKSDKN
jgi:hypothetical protein